MFSRITRNRKSTEALSKDIAALEAFIRLLFQSDTHDPTHADAEALEALQQHSASLAALIENLPGRNEMSATQIASEFAKLDTAVEANSVRIAAWIGSAAEGSTSQLHL
jgi:hypothetical protein